MRVLVTGGAGYVGSVSVERLIEAGHDVVVLDDLSTGHREAVPDVASLEVGSYGDPERIGRLLERAQVDAILHCAARSGWVTHLTNLKAASCCAGVDFLKM